MPTWVRPPPLPSAKNTISPGRRSLDWTLLERLYFHCPSSLMGSPCPNLAQVLLVRHVQLICLAVQVAYLYLVPRYLLACWTTALREFDFPALAANIESSASAALGGVPAPREGSLRPALPAVQEPRAPPPH